MDAFLSVRFVQRVCKLQKKKELRDPDFCGLKTGGGSVVKERALGNASGKAAGQPPRDDNPLYHVSQIN